MMLNPNALNPRSQQEYGVQRIQPQNEVDMLTAYQQEHHRLSMFFWLVMHSGGERMLRDRTLACADRNSMCADRTAVYADSNLVCADRNVMCVNRSFVSAPLTRMLDALRLGAVCPHPITP